jgi:sialic acid synthase SpsE
MLAPLRPLRGIPAERTDELIGKALRRDIAEGEFLAPEDVEW